jgi:DNA-binding LytR/AlgR family response regulator
MNCIIVEDEAASRELVKDYVRKTPGLELKGSFSDAFAANDYLTSHTSDLIFLDINMPGLNGIHFYQSLPQPPLVIFTTAYPEYAVQGFELDAVDYLLKPFSFDRFLRAVNKAHVRVRVGQPVETPTIYLQSDKKIHKVPVDHILFLEAMGDYVKVYLKEQMLIVHETLTGLKEQLPEEAFIRTHKSYVASLINFDFIEGNVMRYGKLEVPISLTYRGEVMGGVKGK